MRLLFFGMFGICCEVGFTAARSFVKNRDFSLIGHTSLWMFPIYAIGLTCGFDLIRDIIEYDIIRWMSYPLWIWLVEVLFGLPTVKAGLRIWDYHYLPESLHWRGIVSFAHAPVWVSFGIMVEAINGRLF